MNQQLFDKIYNEIISLWPEHIDVQAKTFFDDGGMRAPALIEWHDKISDFLESNLPEYSQETEEYIEWSELVEWEIFSLLRQNARTMDAVYPKKLDKGIVLTRCLENEDYSGDWKV